MAIAQFLLALAAAAAAATAVHAQDVPQVISPLRVETDHNGVNLINGKTRMEPPVLSVPGAPNLRFDRVQNAAPYVRGKVEAIPGGGGGYSSASYSVHTGTGSSESFHCTDFDCESVTGTGSIFVPHALYRQAGSAALYRFNLKHFDSMGPPRTLQYYASSVTYPNGEVISYTYETTTGGAFNQTYYRPTTITSSLGFFISLAYQGDTFGTNEWGQVSEAAIYSSAAPLTPLRRLTYGGGGATITDLGDGTGPARVFSCPGCANQLGVNIEISAGSIQLPGEGSPALQAVAHPSASVVASVTRDGVPWTYAYDNLRLRPGTQEYWYDRLTVAGPNGFNQVYNMTLSSQRNVITSVTDSIQRTTSYEFDEAYRPTQAVFPEGNRVNVAYDERGNLYSRQTTPTTGSAIEESAHFPADTCITAGTPVLCWRPSWSRDGLGRQTDYAYNDRGQLTEQTDPPDASGVRRKTYVEYETSAEGVSRRRVVRICGDTAACGTSAEIRTEYDYGGPVLLPTVERRIDAAQGVTLETHYTYDLAGRVTSVDGPLPGSDDATYSRYDVHGRRTWEIGGRAPNGLRIATRTAYRDSDDRPIYTETGTIPDPDSDALTVFRRTDLAYDGRRNAVREAVSSAGTTHSVAERSFDDRGQLLCTAVRMDPAAFGSPPTDACTLWPQGTGANNFGPDRITSNFYDAAGQRLQLREGVGTAVEAAEATWDYSPNGQVRTVIDGNGNRAELRYDGHGRQDRWTFPSTTRPSAYNDATQATALATAGSVNAADYEEYGYDDAGNRTSLRKRDGSVLTYQYDALNRVIVKVVPERAGLPEMFTRDVYYSYDLRGQVTDARFGAIGGEGVANTYDGFGRLLSSRTSMAGTNRTLAYRYDAAGNRIRITHADDVYFTATYDALNRPSWAYDQNGYGLLSFWFNARGEHVGLSRGNGAGTSFAYDAIGRMNLLDQALAGTAADATWTFAHNPAGQIAGQSWNNGIYAWTGHYAVDRDYTTDGLNRYTAAGGPSFAYDANANLIWDGTRQYDYDVENRLIWASGGRGQTPMATSRSAR